ncbi:unnamed protein product [Soboliphyme baturini]|uniref:Beta-lactamase domain-containing protein n=1 Tax=Soboliphyme baturini TaxID=241478 RepID=A0A183IB85_9BILA|nr:unnamed protein product [Soboliphyme baturini]
MHRLLWDGQILEEFSMSIGRLPIFNTNVRSRPDYLSTVLLGEEVHGSSVSFRDMRYSPLIGGFVVVLTDGRAGLMIAASPRFDPSVSVCMCSSFL